MLSSTQLPHKAVKPVSKKACQHNEPIPSNHDDCDHLSSGKIIDEKWRLIKKLGQGSFGKIYEAVDIKSNKKVAIKFESTLAKKKVLKIEIAILKKLKNTESPYASTCHGFGSYFHNENVELPYFVMPLHGMNLSEIRKLRPENRFSLATTALLGYQMVDALSWLHQLGYLHRDVKPSNYVLGLDSLPDHHGAFRPRVYLIDFGLSRRHLGIDGSARQFREATGFRGTTRYASINAHLGSDLGRRDDLFPLTYVFFEFLTGQLPWRRERDKDKIATMKTNFPKDPQFLTLPEPFRLFYYYLEKMTYAAAPDYSYLLDLIEKAFRLSGASPHIPYDWQEDKSKSVGFMNKCKQTACEFQQKLLKSSISHTSHNNSVLSKSLLPDKKEELQLCRFRFLEKLRFNRNLAEMSICMLAFFVSLLYYYYFAILAEPFPSLPRRMYWPQIVANDKDITQ